MLKECVRYSAICDQCGVCLHDLGEQWCNTLNQLREECWLRDWQYDTKHYYCQEHWHVTCRLCSKHDVAPLSQLLDEGWNLEDNTGFGWCGTHNRKA